MSTGLSLSAKLVAFEYNSGSLSGSLPCSIKNSRCFGIDQDDHIDFIELQVPATRFTKAANHLAIGFAEIGIKFFEGDRRRSHRGWSCRDARGTRSAPGLSFSAPCRLARPISDNGSARSSDGPRTCRVCRRTVRERFRLAALKTFDVRR